MALQKLILGIGGGGGNAINRMITSSVKEVEFWAINTDAQALEVSLAEKKFKSVQKLLRARWWSKAKYWGRSS